MEKSVQNTKVILEYPNTEILPTAHAPSHQKLGTGISRRILS